MSDNKLSLQLLNVKFALCKLDAQEPIPVWATQAEDFFSITKTVDELSVVCPQSFVPEGVKAERNWRAFKIIGPLDFALTGILSSLIAPLAEHSITIFAISTYDTDYVLVKDEQCAHALELLRSLYVLLV